MIKNINGKWIMLFVKFFCKVGLQYAKLILYILGYINMSESENSIEYSVNNAIANGFLKITNRVWSILFWDIHEIKC